jgi:protein MAK11
MTKTHLEAKGTQRPAKKAKLETAAANVSLAKKRSPPKPTATLPATFKVIAGSYEKLLYGLEGSITAVNSELSYHLDPIFIFPAHVSCIKAVAASPNGGKWLATGSADEIVKVWDLRRRKEVGGLMHHEGSSSSLIRASDN